MSNYTYPLATSSWDDEEIKAIQQVIKENMYSMGEQVYQFEKEFADYNGSKFAVMVNSGSSANLIMIAALRFTDDTKIKLNPGDEVIVPAISWSTSYYPLMQYGLKLKFVDVDLHTLNYDLQALSEAISNRTKAILVVNLLGNPNDFNEIQRMAAVHNVSIIEDNCESMGANFSGKRCGSFGLMGTFSSYFSHHISTMEGGLIVTDNEQLYHALLCLRAHGWTRNLPKENFVTGIKSENKFDESFKFVLPGYNVRPIEMSGSIGRVQLRKLPSFIAQRRRNADMFKSVMDQFPNFVIQKEIGESSWFGFSLILDPKLKKTRLEILNMLDEASIETRPIVAGNFVKNPVIQYADYEVHKQLTNADYVHNNGFFIGNNHIDLSNMFDRLSDTLKSI